LVLKSLKEGVFRLHSSFDVSLTNNNTAINTALTPCNLEETVQTPSWAPRVSNKPIVGAIFITPTNDLDGMTTQSAAASMSVDTTSVVHEVLVDSESSFDRTILENVSLDGSWVRELNSGVFNTVVLLDGGTISTLSEALAGDGLSTVV